ncbi:MAG TPA: TonB-dependent receptor [Opitutaceae bacterium]|nr:TonB-dependent receptor [Opitutaceae bacterium]HND62577.1 TonB-dependent receptor [Opitutaceae bacterium]
MNHTNPSAPLKRMFIACAALAAATVIAHAQSTSSSSDPAKPDEKITKLNPFVVSSDNDKGYRTEQTLVGSRTAKDLAEIPGSVSIINKEQIDDLNAVEVHEVLQFGVAGVTQNQTINDDVNIRGFRTTFSLRDGVTKTGFKRNPMYDVERIEVIKGPGAMLLGNNTFLGGGVNFVTVKPSEKPSGDAQITVSKNNYVRLAANVGGPLHEDKSFRAAYRFTLGTLTADKDKEIENEDQLFLGAGLSLFFGQNTSLLVNGYYFRDNGYFYWEDFLDYTTTLGTTTAPMLAKLNQYSTKGFSPARSKNAFWKNQDSFVDVTLLTKFTENANLRLYYFGGNLVDRRRIVRGITITADNHTLLRQDIPLAIDNYTNNIQGDFAHKWTTDAFVLDTTVGFDASSTFQRQDQSVNSMPSIDTAAINFPTTDDAWFAAPHPGAGQPNSSQSISRPLTLSYYFQENLSFFKDRLILVGGLRWFLPGGNTKNNITGVVTDSPDKQFDTHKYGIVVRPIPDISAYYTDSSNAFPQVGFTDRYQGNDGLGAPLSTQEGKMKEYGLKVDHHFSPEIAAYGTWAHYDMQLTHVRTFGVLPEGIPAGSIGIVESQADLAQGWELEFGMRFNDAAGTFDLMGTYCDGDSQTAADKTLKAVDFVPRKQSLMAKYTWKSGPLAGFMFGATYFDQTTKRNANFWIDFPATYNVFARYAWGKHWSVQLNLNNVTDERYIVAIAANGLVQTEPGFEGMLSAKYKW